MLRDSRLREVDGIDDILAAGAAAHREVPQDRQARRMRQRREFCGKRVLARRGTIG